MQQLIKQWEERLIAYQNGIDTSSNIRDKSFWKGKKAALEIDIKELKNFISLNNCVSGSLPNDLLFAKWISEMASSTSKNNIWLDEKLYEKTTEELYERYTIEKGSSPLA